MATLTLPVFEAVEMARAVHPHVSKDDVTPVLTTAVIRGGAVIGTDRYSMVRYAPLALQRRQYRTLGHVDREPEPFPEDAPDALLWDGDHRGDLPIPGAALRLIAGISRKDTVNPGGLLPGHRVVIEADTMGRREGEEQADYAERLNARREAKVNPTVTVSLIDHAGQVEFMRRFAALEGTFPPVERLIAEWAPAAEPGPVGWMAGTLDKATTFARWARLPFRMEQGATPKHNGRTTSRLAPVRVTVGTKADEGRLVMLLQPTIITA